MRIILIGFMSSGKTTVGRYLARKTNMEFIDIDEAFENRYKMSITSFFDLFGETKFRELEHQILIDSFNNDNAIIATGGGTPCFFDNMEFMNGLGDTIYLRTSVRELRDRLKMSRTKRPLLSHKTDSELESNIAEMLEMREQSYLKAKFILDTDDLNPNNLLSSYLAMHEV